ncbi:MAG: hypothetical protein ABF697_09035 [Zymomonas mobilis]|uniref:hypothetical protein n=1 Tax=Zymomonas mobilis TaxID=542 RepID=UPI0039E94237
MTDTQNNPAIISIGEYDATTQLVDVTFQLVDKTGAVFNNTRPINAVTDYDGNYDLLQTQQRACSHLAGDMGKVLSGTLSKKIVDDRAAHQAKLAEQAAEAAAAMKKAQEEAAAAEAAKKAQEEADAAKQAEAEKAAADLQKKQDAATAQSNQSTSTTAPAA